MANIDFGDTPGEQLATLMLVVNSLHLTINGNGHPGLKARAEQFMSEYVGAKNHQEQQHAANSRKLNWLLVIATVIMAWTGIVGIIVTVALHGRM